MVIRKKTGLNEFTWIFTTPPYALEFKGSTNVLFNNEWVPLSVAIETSKMEAFLAQNL
jgi:hypothetical protein